MNMNRQAGSEPHATKSTAPPYIKKQTFLYTVQHPKRVECYPSLIQTRGIQLQYYQGTIFHAHDLFLDSQRSESTKIYAWRQTAVDRAGIIDTPLSFEIVKR
mmetsp:Transcript_35027/g.73889  ORF Transcript_35027/g.73889 Transcript_35027/m.73889 type:complete len:102 (-) Transcript_35027:676-981(-)